MNVQTVSHTSSLNNKRQIIISENDRNFLIKKEGGKKVFSSSFIQF